MTNLFLRYRNDNLSEWIELSDFSKFFPRLPIGSLPVLKHKIEIDDLTNDLILNIDLKDFPLPAEKEIITFIMNFKIASYHEIKYECFGQGGYVNAKISNVKNETKNIYFENDAVTKISFKLSSSTSDALINFK